MSSSPPRQRPALLIALMAQSGLLLLAGCASPRTVGLEIPAVPLALRADRRLVSIRLTGQVAERTPQRITVEDLERLPQTEYTVRDPYTKRRTTFRGVLVRDFVKRYGRAEVGALRFRALDDFKAELDRSDWERWDVLLATRADGARMTIATNGPARIVFPYDRSSEINATIYNDKWIWQINRVAFEQ